MGHLTLWLICTCVGCYIGAAKFGGAGASVGAFVGFVAAFCLSLLVEVLRSSIPSAR